MNRLFYYIVFLVIASCSNQFNFIQLSNEIYNRRIGNSPQYKAYEEISNKLRIEYWNQKKLNFISYTKPLFIIEGYDIETDEMYYTMLNDQGELSYIFNEKGMNEISNSFYKDEFKKLIIDWDIIRIKKLEQQRGLSGGLSITANKLVFNKHGSIKKVQRVNFNEFN